MSDLKVTGRIKVIGEKQVFDSGFSKVEFVVTTQEQYPQDIKFEAIKEKADNLIQYNKVGDLVDVSFNIRGNEYNGRYFVNLQSWMVRKNEGSELPTEPISAPVPTDSGDDDLPF